MKLDDTRLQILAAPGHLLIEGGPGCGKTTIALLKAGTVLTTLQAEQRVLFLSFSRAAVRQISDRMRGTLTRAERARLEVRTFHSFFLELVRAHGPLLTGKPSSFIAPDRERQLRADFTDGDWTEETERLAREEGRYVFDRLAATAAALLNRVPAVRELYSGTYPLVIVDEFQDTNEDQWDAVRALSAASTIICLADPDQRIYDFVPGVDEKRIEHAVDHLTPRQFDLSKDNHRSPSGGLLDYANAVLRNDPTQPVPKNIKTWKYGWPVTCEETAHTAIIRVREHLERQLGRTPTIAVLAPTNALVAQVSEKISNDQPSTQTPGTVLPAIDHELNWDPDLSAAAGYVVASIMEWPGQDPADALTSTLNAITDFYRIKLAGGTKGARATITTIGNAIAAMKNGKAIRSKAATVLKARTEAYPDFTGNPVTDWQIARSRLHGADELEEIFAKARLLRLFKATDALAWALMDIWNGRDAYPGAALAVRRVLANETLEAAQAEPVPVTLMNMHKSKGKEFDAVIIVEGQYHSQLLQPDWTPARTQAGRRLLRVAITRARSIVIFVRPPACIPLTS